MINLPHSVRGWLRLMDLVCPSVTAMGDEWKDTFLVPFDGDEMDLYGELV